MRFRILRQTSEKNTSKDLLACLKVQLETDYISSSFATDMYPAKAGISWLLWNILTVNSRARKIRKLPPHSLAAFIVIYSQEKFRILL